MGISLQVWITTRVATKHYKKLKTKTVQIVFVYLSAEICRDLWFLKSDFGDFFFELKAEGSSYPIFGNPNHHHNFFGRSTAVV